MERQSKGLRGLEAYCNGGQGPPRAVAPLKKKIVNIPKNAHAVLCARESRTKYGKEENF